MFSFDGEGAGFIILDINCMRGTIHFVCESFCTHFVFCCCLDTMIRLVAMAFKLVLLMYYKNGKGLSFRRQVMQL